MQLATGYKRERTATINTGRDIVEVTGIEYMFVPLDGSTPVRFLSLPMYGFCADLDPHDAAYSDVSTYGFEELN